MKVAFVHDHKFRKCGDALYSPGGLSNEVLSRYARWFDQVSVVARILPEETAQPTYSKITDPAVTVTTARHLEQTVAEADCLIARLPSRNGYRAIAYAKKHRKPYMVEVVGCTFDAYWHYGLKGKLAAVPAFLLMRACVKNAPYALYVTTGFLQKRYPCRGETAGISDVAIEEAGEEVLKKRLKRPAAGPLVLGTAGAVDVKYKGQEWVIRALPMLSRRLGRDVIYRLAGAGDPGRLRAAAQEAGVLNQVVFEGVIQHNSLFSWLDELDIYVQPSRLEGLSRALAEAMSRGLPCVATRVGGNPELLEGEHLFSPHGPMAEGICDCIEGLVAPEAYWRAAQRNHRFIFDDFSPQKLEQRRDRFYASFRAYAQRQANGR